VNDVAAKDLYAVLGVAPDAPAREIRRAYRRRARQHHPDLNPQPEGSEQFARLAQAYEILHDPAQRAHYDRSLPQPRPARNHHHPVPPMVGRVRHGTLELSQAETVYLTHSPLALHDADGHTILLPAGARDGDQIFVPGGAYTAVLTIRTNIKT
jgi:curved DNA-binding protein CbpA